MTLNDLLLNYLKNEPLEIKRACYVLCSLDLEGFLQEGYTKGQLIRRKYYEMRKEYWLDTTTAKPLLYKAFDLLLEFNRNRQKLEELERELRHDIYNI